MPAIPTFGCALRPFLDPSVSRFALGGFKVQVQQIRGTNVNSKVSSIKNSQSSWAQRHAGDRVDRGIGTGGKSAVRRIVYFHLNFPEIIPRHLLHLELERAKLRHWKRLRIAERKPVCYHAPPQGWRTQAVKGAVCKTAIQRFKSARHLPIYPTPDDMQCAILSAKWKTRRLQASA